MPGQTVTPMPEADNTHVTQEGVPGPKLFEGGGLEDFGGGASLQQAGQAGAEISSNVSDIIAREKRQADMTFAMNGSTAGQDRRNQILSAPAILSDGSKNPNAGLLNLQGRDALGAEDKFSEAWEKYKGEALAAAINPSQRQQLDESLTRQGVEAVDSIRKHTDQQIHVAAQQDMQTHMDKSSESAGLLASHGNMQGSEDSIRSGVSAFDHYNEMYPGSLTPDALASAKSDYVEKCRSNIASSMIDKNPHAAQAYMNQHLADFNDPAKLEKLKDAIHTGIVTADGTYQANKAVFEATKESKANSEGLTSPEYQSRVMAKIDKISDPEVRKVAEQTWAPEFSRQLKEQDVKNEAFVASTLKNLTPDQLGKPVAAVVSAAQFESLKPKERAALVEGIQGPAKPIKKEESYTALQQFISDYKADPASIANMSLTGQDSLGQQGGEGFIKKYYAKMARPEQEIATKIWQEAHDKVHVDTPTWTRISKFNDTVNGVISTLKLDPKNPQAYDDVSTKLKASVEEFKVAKNHEPGADDLQKMSDKIVLDNMRDRVKPVQVPDWKAIPSESQTQVDAYLEHKGHSASKVDPAIKAKIYALAQAGRKKDIQTLLSEIK